MEQLVARQAHNLEVACSSPASATLSNRGSSIEDSLFSFSFFPNPPERHALLVAHSLLPNEHQARDGPLDMRIDSSVFSERVHFLVYLFGSHSSL